MTAADRIAAYGVIPVDVCMPRSPRRPRAPRRGRNDELDVPDDLAGQSCRHAARAALGPARVVVVVAVIGYRPQQRRQRAGHYLTPTELLARGDGAIGQTAARGGCRGGEHRREAPDLARPDRWHHGSSHATSAPTRSFREGIGAVVEGSWR
jgi:hypothetical protein